MSFIYKMTSFIKKHEYFRVFLFIFTLAFLFYCGFAIPNQFTTPLGGDYVLQSIPFYHNYHDVFTTFLKTGNFPLWSSTGFLGVNYYGANLFYNLLSPFTFLVLLVPKSLVTQAIFFTMLLRLATGGLFFYILVKRYFHINEKLSLLGAVVYALGGWSLFYMWFPFSDVLALFPLLFIGIEHLLQKNKGTILAVAIIVIGITNYFFLFSFLISALFYTLFRYFIRFKQNSLRINIIIVIKGLLFTSLSLLTIAFILLPSLAAIQELPRYSQSGNLLQFMQLFFVNPSEVNNVLVLGELKSLTAIFDSKNLQNIFQFLFVFYPSNPEQQTISLLYPIIQFIFPTLSCWDTLVITNSSFENIIGSTFISTPLSLLFWPSAFLVLKSKKVWKITALLFMILLPFIPISYHLFHGFSMFYGRWQIFLFISLLIFMVHSLQRYKEITPKALTIGFCFQMTLALISIVYSASINRLDYEYKIYLIVFQLIFMIFVYLFLLKKMKKETFISVLTPLIIIELLFATNITLVFHGVQSYQSMYGGRDHIVEQQQIINEIKEKDSSFFRIFNTLASRNDNNLSMMLGYNGLATFHSVYNFALDPFINDYSEVSYGYNSWSMGIHEKRVALEDYLGVKYYIVENDDFNIPHGYKLFKKYNLYSVYENTNFIELGFATKQLYDKNKLHLNNNQVLNLENAYSKVAFVDEVVIQNNPQLQKIDEIPESFQTIKNYKTSFIHQESPNEKVSFNGMSNLASVVNNKRKDRGGVLGKTLQMNGDKILLEWDEGKNICPTNTCNVVVDFAMGPNVVIKMFQDNQLVVEDSHMIHNYNIDYDQKSLRGFYIDQPVNKVEIEFLNNYSFSTFTHQPLNVYSQSYSDYVKGIEESRKYPFHSIKVNENDFSFKTNYKEDLFLILQVPFDSGWSLKVNGEAKPIYKVNGGFIGLNASQGDTLYELSFTPKDLQKGLDLSALGLLFLLLFIGYEYRYELMKWRKKKSEK